MEFGLNHGLIKRRAERRHAFSGIIYIAIILSEVISMKLFKDRLPTLYKAIQKYI